MVVTEWRDAQQAKSTAAPVWWAVAFQPSSVAVVCGMAEMYLRIGSVPADKPCHSFLWRGSIQNCPPESKHGRKLLDPSREIEERKTEVGLDQDHLLSAKAFGVDRGQLLQHAWTTGLERDDRLIESLIARAWSTKLCELKDLGENGATDYLKNSISIWNKSNSSDTMSLKTFEDARKVAYKTGVYARCTHTEGSVSCKNGTAYELCTLRIETNIFRLESMGMVFSDRLTSKTLEIQRNRSLVYSDIPSILLGLEVEVGSSS